MPVFDTFAELAAYLMVYIARVDGQMHYLEEAALNEQMHQFVSDPDPVVQKVGSLYHDFPLAKVEEVLKANQELIGSSSFEDRMELIRSLYGIINSDGRVQEEEMATLRAVRSALEQSAEATPVVVD